MECDRHGWGYMQAATCFKWSRCDVVYPWGRFGLLSAVPSIMAVLLVILAEGRLVEFVSSIGASGTGASSTSECLRVVTPVVRTRREYSGLTASNTREQDCVLTLVDFNCS